MILITTTTTTIKKNIKKKNKTLQVDRNKLNKRMEPE